MTAAEAAEELLKKMFVNDKLKWASMPYVGHILANVDQVAPTFTIEQALAYTRLALSIVANYDYTATGIRDEDFVFSERVLEMNIDLDVLRKIFPVAQRTCHYRALCCDNLSNTQLWTEYDTYIFEQYSRKATGNTH